MNKNRLPVWQIPVTETLDRLLEEAVSKGIHVSKSDLVREAVREKLARMGFSDEKEPLMNPGPEYLGEEAT